MINVKNKVLKESYDERIRRLRNDRTFLSKADVLMDSLQYKGLMRAKGATGYLIEVLQTP